MKKSQKTKKNENFLLLVPKLTHTNWKEEKNIVTLFFEHNRRSERILQKLLKKPSVTDVELDEYGSWIWKHIDGKKNVKEIADDFLAKFTKETKVYERLTVFIGYLYRKKWIQFVAEEKVKA